jgi:HEAT repeat protein
MWKHFIPMLTFVLSALLASPNLAQAQQPEKMKALIGQLKDKDEAVRLKAAKELGRFKADAKDAIPDLKAACTDPDEDVRTVAKKSLVMITEAVEEANREKDLAALETQLKALRAAKTPKDKIAVIRQLAELGEKAKEAGLTIVSLGMMDTNLMVREAASAAYEKIDPAVHKEIVAVLHDKDPEAKSKAIKALAALGLKGKAAAPALKYIYVEDRKEPLGNNLWEPALTALTKIAPEDVTVHDAILAIIANPRESQNAQELALKLMKTVKIDTKKKVTALIAGLSGTNYRAHMIGELAGLRGEAKAALPILNKLKLDPDAEVRKAATEAVDAIKE